MKKQHFLIAAMTVMMASTTATGWAQQAPAAPAPPPPPSGVERPESEHIIIKKKSGKGEKMTIVVDGDRVTVNGKPLADYQGDDIIINQKRMHELASRDYDMAKMNKQLAEMDYQLADLDRQIRVQVEPRIRKAYKEHLRGPGLFYSEDAPMAFTFSDDGPGGEKRALLGVSTEKTEKGVRITDLTDGSAAEKAGLAEGDIITSFDGKKVTDHEALTKLVREHNPGDEVSLTYLHDGKSKKTKAKLGETRGGFRSFNFTAPSPDGDDIEIEMPDMPGMSAMPAMPGVPFNEFRSLDRGPRLGVQIEDVPEGKGVKVNEVRPESPAAKAGIQKDDIITHVDNKDVKEAGDMIDALKDAKEKYSFWITVQRKGAPVNMEVKIPKPIRKAELKP